MIKFGSTNSTLSKKRRLPFGKIGLTLLAGTMLFFGTQSWAFTGASIDLDFVNQRIAGATSLSAALSITRGSIGTAEMADGTQKQFASGELRITDKGLLVEESRTNSIRNSAGSGTAGIAGSGGVLPSNWAVIGANGLTKTYAYGTEKGMSYTQIRLNGTMADSANTQIRFEANTQVVAVPGESWAGSVGLALVGGSLTNITTIAVSTFERNSGGSYIGGTSIDVKASLTSTPQRFLAVKTIGGTGAYAQNEIGIFAANGTAIDITLRFYWPQLEKGAFATSPIPTTGTAVTRQADVILLNNPTTFLSLTAGSIYSEWNEPNGPSGLQKFICLVRVDPNNYMMHNVTATNKAQAYGRVSAVDQFNLASTSNVAANTTYKMASRWAANDFAARIAGLGAQPVNDTSGSVLSGVYDIRLGSSGGTVSLNGYLRRFAIFPTAQNDDNLTAMVA